MRIEYPITSEYVNHWGEWEAVREVIQNALDYGNNSITHSNERISVISYDAKLEMKHLLLGCSEKGSDSIGKYGEGLKLALLVSAKMNLEMSIITGDKIITSAIEYSDKFGVDVMVLYICDTLDNINNIEISLKCSEETYRKYDPHIPFGPRAGTGMIYVCGLFVCKMPDFEYDINFKPGQVTLNRDRDIVSLWDISREVTYHMNSGIGTVLLDDSIRSAPHINQHFANGSVLAKQWVTKFGTETLPILPEEQTTKKGIVVPRWLHELLHSVLKFLKPDKSPLDLWIDKYSSSLPSEAIEELKEIVNQ